MPLRISGFGLRIFDYVFVSPFSRQSPTFKKKKFCISNFFWCLYFWFAGDRTFPPQSGISFSVWFCVDQFGSMSENRDHAVRLLTIVRTASSSGPEISCFSLMLSSKERKLILSTLEEPLGRTGKYIWIFLKRSCVFVRCFLFLLQAPFMFILRYNVR